MFSARITQSHQSGPKTIHQGDGRPDHERALQIQDTDALDAFPPDAGGLEASISSLIYYFRSRHATQVYGALKILGNKKILGGIV